MRRARAAAGTPAFLVLVPGVVAGLIPWALTGWRAGDVSPYLAPLRLVGLLLLAAGCGALLLLYAVLYASVVTIFVNAYEEPTLLRRFGEAYEEYRRAVPAWRPRRAPWKAGRSIRPPSAAPGDRTA